MSKRGLTTQSIPYWNVNVSKDEWTKTCPDYLQNLTSGDVEQLSILDSDYKRKTWREVSEIVDTNQLQAFKRVPSDLHRYRKYIKGITDSHGSVLAFILKERLCWAETNPRGAPFENSSDVKILFNDWPYGIDTEIVHLVVWTKFGFEEDHKTGDLTPAARRQIDEFVTRTFRSQHDPAQVSILDPEISSKADVAKLLWFKNWSSLKSVHAIEHFHIMLCRPDQDFVRRITGGDVSMSVKQGVKDAF